MVKLTNLNLKPGDSEERLYALAAERLGVRARDIEELVILRRGLDARRRGAIRWVYSVRVRLRGEAPEPDAGYEIPRLSTSGPRPLVAGVGPAGLFATVPARAGRGRFNLTTNDPVYLGGVTPQPGCEGRCLVFHTGGAFPTGCGHTGFTGTSLWIDRERGFGLALLTNRLCYDHLPQADMNAFRRAVHTALLEELK